MRALLAALGVSHVLAAPPALGVDLERLLMPGEVIAAHRDVESNCGACHQRFDRSAQTRLCLDCHELVAEDRSSLRGFHGRLSTAREAACSVCHTEHRGRDADAVGLDRGSFDHDHTDFPLKGTHAALSCEQCHSPDTPFRDTNSACVDCHRDAEPHGGRLGTQCQDCHGTTAWARVRFVHASTGFALEGRHAEAACASCHPAEAWKGAQTDCVACHRADDAHRGTFGPRCGDCHSPSGWQEEGFDHDRDTRFRLSGVHRRTGCHSCHLSDPRETQVSRDCYGCHRADDEHRGANGRSCATCHDSDSWSRVSFEHDRDTDFPLVGEHRGVGCDACHRGPPREVATESACVGCHATNDAHRGQEGRDCGVCHDPSTWRGARFDHELTRFPLLGLHAVATCEQCHASAAFRDAETGCASCHQDDDSHRGALGADCQLCHNPNDWRVWEFDHELKTRFTLEGAHAGLACGACHRAPVRGRAMRRDCESCHGADDAHSGALGENCGRCHETTSWTEVRVR